jgi:hypothetical protein
MTLIDLIKNSLREDDKKILSLIDLEKTEDEIIEGMVKASILKFEIVSDENKEIK